MVKRFRGLGFRGLGFRVQSGGPWVPVMKLSERVALGFGSSLGGLCRV